MVSEEAEKCSICKINPATQKHHVSYDPELTVNVCAVCHTKIHDSGTGVPAKNPKSLKKRKYKYPGRPPDPNRKTLSYLINFGDRAMIDNLDIIAGREGVSRRKIVLKFLREGMEKHAPGNPQTLLNSYAEGGTQTINQLVGQIRQKFYNRGGASRREILGSLQEKGIKGKERASIADGIIMWLRDHGLKVSS